MKIMNARHVIAAAILLCAGCTSYQAAQHTELAIMVLHPGEGEPPLTTIYLPNDFGFLIKWNETTSPEFFVYSRQSFGIRQFTNFQSFLNELRELPRGAKVDAIQKCTVPFDHGMPTKEREELARVIREKEFHLTGEADGNFIICTCQSSRIELLGTANNRLEAIVNRRRFTQPQP